MQRFIDDEIAPAARRVGRQRAIVDALQRGQLKLEYDSELTRNAAEAFAARSGNCLSLVLMTAAFAKALDLPVAYQKVFVADEWARVGDIYLAIGHVNLTLGKRATDAGGTAHRVGVKPLESEGLTIDFLPPDDMIAHAHAGDRRGRAGGDVHEQPGGRGTGAGQDGRRVLVGARGHRAGARFPHALQHAGRRLPAPRGAGAGGAGAVLRRRARARQPRSDVEPRQRAEVARPHRRVAAARRAVAEDGSRSRVLALQARAGGVARRRPARRPRRRSCGKWHAPRITTSSTSGWR